MPSYFLILVGSSLANREKIENREKFKNCILTHHKRRRRMSKKENRNEQKASHLRCVQPTEIVVDRVVSPLQMQGLYFPLSQRMHPLGVVPQRSNQDGSHSFWQLQLLLRRRSRRLGGLERSLLKIMSRMQLPYLLRWKLRSVLRLWGMVPHQVHDNELLLLSKSVL